MGMTCTLCRVNETDLRWLREEPARVSAFIYGEPVPMEEVREPGIAGFILRLLGIKVQQVRETPDESTNQQIQDSDKLDIDKAWDGLNYLFTGTAEGGEEPACFLLSGGEAIGHEEDGDRVLRPDQVSQFAAFLAELSADEIARRYDPTRMAALGIYPEVIWTRPEAPGESAFDYVFSAFEDLRDFVIETSTPGDSLIVSIT